MSNTPNQQQAVAPKEHVVQAETRNDWADYFSVNVIDNTVRVSFGRFRQVPAPQIQPEVDISSVTVLTGQSGANFISQIAQLHANLVESGMIVPTPAPQSPTSEGPTHVILPRQ